jgi:hypothetical protein
VKRPQRILEVFKTLSDEAAREVAELRDARQHTLHEQVEVLRSIETGWDIARRDRSLARSAARYGIKAQGDAENLRRKAEQIARHQAEAQDRLLDRFADQKRFELYLSQRQLKERAVARKREEGALLEQIDQLAQAKERKDR